MSAETGRNRVCVVGAGLSGSLTAVLLAKLGMQVSLFEKRSDPRHEEDNETGVSAAFGMSASASKRSINLALSTRGMLALEEAGILNEVMKTAISMPCRIIHNVDGTEATQPYGKEGQAIWSVGRQMINNLLLDLTAHYNVRTYFGFALTDVDASGRCTFRTENSTNEQHIEVFDLVVGADGAFSRVRDNVLRKSRADFHRRFIVHGYKELTIPPRISAESGAAEFALERPNGLHIWPRQNGEFMLIALPNPDKSFTATLFAPYHGPAGFDAIDPDNKNQIIDYFQKYFPDVLPLMPDLVHDYRSNPIGSLLTLRVNPWNMGRVVLLGDASHAVVPFYGQGMNAGFQDGLMLYHILKKRQAAKGCLGADELADAAAQFAELRRPATDALADLCLQHYYDMAANTASTFYLLRKRLEGMISALMPNIFIPMYTMVAFMDIPYHEAVARAERQDRWLGRILGAGVFGVIAALGWAGSRAALVYRNTKN